MSLFLLKLLLPQHAPICLGAFYVVNRVKLNIMKEKTSGCSAKCFK